MVHKHSTEVTLQPQYMYCSCLYISIGTAVNTEQHSSTEGTTHIMTVQQSQKQNDRMTAQHKSKTILFGQTKQYGFFALFYYGRLFFKARL
jgi:hypothetical protein